MLPALPAPAEGPGPALPVRIGRRALVRRAPEAASVVRSRAQVSTAFPLPPLLPEFETVNTSYAEPSGALGRHLDAYA